MFIQLQNYVFSKLNNSSFYSGMYNYSDDIQWYKFISFTFLWSPDLQYSTVKSISVRQELIASNSEIWDSAVPTLGDTQLHSLSLITVVHFPPPLWPYILLQCGIFCAFFLLAFFMIQHNAGLFCPVFFSSKLCVPVYFFVIDGKCRVLFIRSNLFFFFKAWLLKVADLLCMFKRSKLLKATACCCGSGPAFVQGEGYKTEGQIS